MPCFVKRGQDPFVRSTLRAVPEKGSCPIVERNSFRWPHVPNGMNSVLLPDSKADKPDRGRYSCRRMSALSPANREVFPPRTDRPTGKPAHHPPRSSRGRARLARVSARGRRHRARNISSFYFGIYVRFLLLSGCRWAPATIGTPVTAGAAAIMGKHGSTMALRRPLLSQTPRSRSAAQEQFPHGARLTVPIRRTNRRWQNQELGRETAREKVGGLVYPGFSSGRFCLRTMPFAHKPGCGD